MQTDPFPLELRNRVARAGVIAVLVIDDVAHAVPVARALLTGGVDAMELTLRTSVAFDALRAIRAEVPDMLAGVGTVIDPSQVEAAVKSGAAFAVAPGCNRRVLSAAATAGLPFAPGIATPSDIETALEFGCRWLKFFPAEPSGGLSFLTAMAGPYSHLGLRYIPLGGLNAQNVAAYLASPLVAALGGSWIAPREQIQSGQYSLITDRAREAVAIIQRIRPNRSALSS